MAPPMIRFLSFRNSNILSIVDLQIAICDLVRQSQIANPKSQILINPYNRIDTRGHFLGIDLIFLDELDIETE